VLTSNSTGNQTVACPTGKTVIGGGFVSDVISNNGPQIFSSGPNALNTAWTVAARCGGQAANLTVYATCANAA